MKLYFIGTSHGVPEKDRRCSSYIIEIDGSFYLIDMGTQVIEELRRREIPVGSVRAVACTHPHGDHTDGLISFVDLLNWYFKEADPLILLPDERLITPIKMWISANDGGRPIREDLRIRSFSEGTVFEDEKLKITAIPTKHCENSFAFFVEAEGKKLLFTSDLCRPDVDFPKIAFETRLDLIVCELAHFSPEECMKAFEKTKAKRIIHSHIYERRWGEALSEEMKKPHFFEYGAAYDGLELEL